MGEVEAVMMVDETSVPQVKVGQKATLSIDAYPNRKFEGTVTEVGSSPIPKNDPDLLSLTAELRGDQLQGEDPRSTDPPDTIRPGFSVTADDRDGPRDGATAIPIQALVVRDVQKKDKKRRRPGRPETEEGVYVVKDGKLAFEKVETGIAGELMIEVKKGPAVGAEIVTGPVQGAAPGQGRRQGHRSRRKAASKKGGPKPA